MYVIVVGGGLTGYNIAKLLVEEGIGVVVIEKIFPDAKKSLKD